jgi:hypothetical protein
MSLIAALAGSTESEMKGPSQVKRRRIKIITTKKVSTFSIDLTIKFPSCAGDVIG